MRIRMLAQRTGPRWDGQDWPPRGGEFDVPDEEGAALCGQGDAVPVVTDAVETPERPDPAVETRTAEAPGATETAAGPPAAESPAPPSVRASRAEWVAHAIARGIDPDAAGQMTKADLIASYGQD